MTAPLALVTGVSRARGIGAAICREFVRRGHSVFFTHWTPFDETNGYALDGGPERILAELQKDGWAECSSFDLTEPGSAVRLLDRVEERMGTPAILVSNAAYWEASNFRSINSSVLDAHMDVNVRATILLSAEFIRRREGQGFGRVISMVSGNDHGGEVDNLAYGATKGAVSAMTRYLALEAAPLGITVNAIDPGPTDTGWMDTVLQREILAATPMGRIGQPEDAAHLVGFLASEESGWVTGQVIRSDGGFPG